MVHKKGKDDFLETFANSANMIDEVEETGKGTILHFYGASIYASLNGTAILHISITLDRVLSVLHSN